MNAFNKVNFRNIIAGFGDKNIDKPSLFVQLKNALNGKIPIMIELEQTHSSDAQIITPDSINNYNSKADAFVTDMKRVALIIRTADCFPIIMCDPINNIIAAIHSGREGTRKNIVKSTINAMISIGSETVNISASVGPGISTAHYQVDQFTWINFCSSTDINQKFPFLNLRKVIIEQLKRSGVRKSKIEVHDLCTWENSNYFSFRRNNDKKRQYNWIMLK